MSGHYTLQGLRDLYRDLLRSHAEATAAAATGRKLPRFKERLIETIRSISELIIYGEQNVDQDIIFDYFCEKVRLLWLLQS